MPTILGRGRPLIALASAAVTLGAVVTPATAAAGDTLSWTISPSAESPTITVTAGSWQLADDKARHRSVKSTERIGTLTFAPKRLGQDVNAVEAAVDASIPAGGEAAVDVRGLRADGTWTEWTEVRPEAPAVLATTTRTVQARLVLSAEKAAAGPRVREIDLTASRRAAADGVSVLGAGLTYRIFATREGLVGGTTANGHVIVSRDHFVALSSRRGLADKNSGNYSVRVCKTDGSRCEWAPVWDVGPWNTKDDYWNPSSTREMWQDLPQGKPEAQAAYQDGYNRGRDQFGRRVTNPAGIDLADGTFWDGLKLVDNAWVTVTYQWTGSGPWGTIAINGPVLNVRSSATPTASPAGLASKYAQVRIECWVTGQSVTGTQGTTSRWFRLAPGKFVSAAYVKVGSTASAC